MHSNARKKNLTASFTYTAYTVYKSLYISLTIPGMTNANLRNKGKDKRQIASLPTPFCP
jgi:hypothetical protein